MIIETFFFKKYIHRRAAKDAEISFFMFAVERPANIKGNPSEEQYIGYT
jgi:hypothetical protein